MAYFRKLGPSFDTALLQYNLSVSVDSRQLQDIRIPQFADRHPVRPFSMNISTQEKCIPGYVQLAMSRMQPGFKIEDHIFLDKSYKSWNYSGNSLLTLEPPFGIGKNNIYIVDRLLDRLHNAGKTDRFGNGCKRCLLVGNSGINLGYKFGSVIDSYDIVIRMNDAPVKGFEEFVGSKTSIRYQYPESGFKNPDDLEDDSDIVFVVFKEADYHWLYSILKNEEPAINYLPVDLPFVPGYRYWQNVPKKLNKTPDRIRILNPHVVLRSAYEHLGTRHRPSIGIISMAITLNYCDQIDITGYGSDENMPYHYYVSPGGKVGKFKVHDWNSEQEFILKLLRYGVIGKDLTDLYAKEVRKRWGDIDN
ncbi:CMP-N-acetylneuraminate-beta-1,4-galactoside alpha-2,3-sialyltransferase-like [Glandiceps talaboti]